MSDKEFQINNTAWLQWHSVQAFAARLGYVYTGKQFVSLQQMVWGDGVVSVNTMIRKHNEWGGQIVKRAKLQFSRRRGFICQNHMVKFCSKLDMDNYMRFLGVKPEKED